MMLNSGDSVKIRIGGRTFSSGSGLEGFALIRTAKVTATRGSLANGSFAFIGDGPLT